MKTFVIIIPFLIFYLSVFAQNDLPVCESKATHLVCPDRVSYLQVGAPSLILAEVVPELPNLVRIKAAKPFEKQSSLTLVCAGRIYTLILDYGDTQEITCQLEDFYSAKAGSFSGGIMPGYILKELSDQILRKNNRQIKGIKAKKDGIKFRLNTIHQKDDCLFLEVGITNNTNLTYQVDGFYFWIDDKRQLKATNTQEYPVNPICQHYNIKVIPGNTTLREVFVLPKLILPDKRILRLEMLEKALGNTGRKLALDIKNKDILEAKSFKVK